MVTLRHVIAFLVSVSLLLSYPAISSLINHENQSAITSSVPMVDYVGDEYDEGVEELIAWIVDNSDYLDLDYPRPIIMRANRAFMTKLWIKLTGTEPRGRISAMFTWEPSVPDDEKGTIFLSMGFNINHHLSRKTLVHELVHYLQNWNGVTETLDCLDQLEHDAYMISAKYLKSVDYPHEYTIKEVESYAKTMSECEPT